MPYLSSQLEAVDSSMPFAVVGRVQAVTGMTLEASDLTVPLGSLCRVHSFGGKTSTAEVIGFRHDKTLLMPLSAPLGVARGDKVQSLSASPRVWCSEQLLGRVLDGFGQPIDGKGPLRLSDSRRIDGRGVTPLERARRCARPSPPASAPSTACSPAASASAWASSPAPASAKARS